MKNWSKYNEALVNRGDITFYFCEAVIDAWEHENDQKKVGRPFTYSDVAVETLLRIRELFRLPYRQTEGFGRALAKLMNAGVAIPDYTSLQKRAAKLGVSIEVEELSGPIDVVVDSTGLKVFGDGEWRRKEHGVDKRRTFRKVHLAVDPSTHTMLGVSIEVEELSGPIDVVVDSTGLKVFGDGEWRRKEHGVDKRRTFRKVHLAVDPSTHTILAHTLTESGTTDASQAEPLLGQINAPVETFYADGAYDTWKLREHLQGESIHQIIPPRENAKIKQHGNSSAEPLERDECVRQIRRDGKQAWKESIGYHRRSLAETAMFRLKTNFGDRLKNQALANQATEVALRCKLLNAFVALGMPLSIWG